MNRIPCIAKSILVGLVVTQVLATSQVLFSNKALKHTVALASKAGYLSIPNEQIALTLDHLGPAIWGGLFFSLSLGVLLSIVTSAVAWAWIRLFGRAKPVLVAILIIWFGLLISLNLEAFSPFVLAYFLLVPLAVFSSTVRLLRRQTMKLPRWATITPIASLLCLIVLWTVAKDKYLFLNIRDFLLLSNSVGQKINGFYYEYTLYPAQVFKTLHQKTLRTCRLEQAQDSANNSQILELLVRSDYLPVKDSGAVDLELVEKGSLLLFKHNGKAIFEKPKSEFLSDSKAILMDFSSQTDSYSFFRTVTFLGVLVGFPIACYMLVFSLLQVAHSFFLSPVTSMLASSALCLLIGIALAMPVRSARVVDKTREELVSALTSEIWQDRVTGLRVVVDKKMDINKLVEIETLLKSSYVPERYWLAKALGISKHPKAYNGLVALLGDGDPNVVCMAFYALGTMGDKRAINEIQNRLKISSHWYAQWYGYRALKQLGWRQSLPN